MEELKPTSVLEKLPLEELLGRKYVTLNNLAKALGVTYQTIRKHRLQAHFHSVKLGGSWIIYEDELRRYLEQGNANTPPVTHRENGPPRNFSTRDLE